MTYNKAELHEAAKQASQKEVFFVRIPHQSSVTVGQCVDNRAEIDDMEPDEAINHDDWSFWNDSSATHTFTTVEEMKDWADSYTGHQWAQVRSKVSIYVEFQ